MITKTDFGKTKDGKPVEKYTIENESGAKVVLTDYGAAVISIIVPDKNGNLTDVALGYDSIKDYEDGCCYFGATCGRYGGRLRNGKFTINGADYNTSKNDGTNTLHGGRNGFHKKVWQAYCEDNSVTFSYVSRDGEEGFPGTLTTSVKYEFSDDNSLRVTHVAKSDKDTVVNLINHTYFNLAGHDSGDAMDQELILNSELFAAFDGSMQSTGEILKSEGTPFDFSTAHTFKERIDEDNLYLKNGRGYDICCILKKTERDKTEIAAQLHSEKTGIRMIIYTTQPAAQIYSGNFIEERAGKGGAEYKSRCAVCIEPQHIPDSMYNTHFPDPVLRAGQMYIQNTVYKFDVVE